MNIEGAEELIVTNADIVYQRISTKFSPLNQKKKYKLTGEANGAITLGMIIGPSRDIVTFLTRYSDACQVTKNVLSLQPAGIKNCADEDFTGIEFICNGVLIDTINVSTSQVGQSLTMVNAGLRMTFLTLQIK